VLGVRPMVPSRQRRRAAGRKAASPVFRALAAFVAVLLTASSLGQIAHFLLVPHAVCADHGELLELSTESDHAGQHHAEAEPPADDEAAAVSPEDATSHDHCEVLASGQRQLALPAASVVALVPAAASSSLALVETSAISRPLATLSLAPKTSPPARGVLA
jgi:hypothetical protein